MNALLVVNGVCAPNLDLAALAAKHTVVIAVDGGLNHLHRHGVVPDVLLGDLDSVDAALRSAAVATYQFPVEKDQTDLEIALEYAVAQQLTEITLAAAFGGRWDQTLANILLALQPRYATLNVCLVDVDQTLYVLHPGREYAFTGSAGTVISLVPMSAEVHDVSIAGVKWPLDAVTLTLGSTWSISNEFVKSTATVHFSSGRLLCIVMR